MRSTTIWPAVWTEPGWSSTFAAGEPVPLVPVLAILSWLILRYSTRLPLRQFFSATSIFMFVLAIIFAGKGIAALQEAGKLPIDPVSFPRIDLLGIYPNMQGLALQGALLALAVFILWNTSFRQRGQATV